MNRLPVFVLVAVLGACAKRELEAAHCKVQCSSTQHMQDMKPRLVQDGKEIASPPSADGTLDVWIDLPRGLSITTSKLAVRLDTTCGTREYPLTLRGLYGSDGVHRLVFVEQEMEIRKGGAEFRASGDASIDDTQTSDLYIDNHGGPERKLTVGSTSVVIPADFVGVKGATVTTCDDPLPVRIDGSGDDSWPKLGYRKVLVDAVGGRCYERRDISYAREGSGKEGSVDATPYSGHRIYELNGAPDYFLKPAPTVVQGVGATQGRSQIAEVPCAPTKHP